MRILGIDPGLRCLGWGVIERQGAQLRHIANGQSTPPHSAPMADRLCVLFKDLSDVIAFYQPDAVAVEQTFVNRDGAGTLKLGQARGVALLAPALAGLEVREYSPNTIKKALVGVGHADKSQVQHIVQLQLSRVKFAGPDAADALAIAICHSVHLQTAHHMRTMLRAAE